MNRRGFLTGALGLLAGPAIVRATSIMPVSAWAPVPRYRLWRATGGGPFLACGDWGALRREPPRGWFAEPFGEGTRKMEWEWRAETTAPPPALMISLPV